MECITTGNNLLHDAAQSGSIKKVEQILAEGHIKIDSRNNTGKTALHLAVSGGHIDLVKMLLLKAGASIDEKDDFGQNCFLLAARFGHLELMKWLRQKYDININSVSYGTEDSFQDSALILAAGSGHCEVVKWLIFSESADIFHKNSNGHNAFTVAVMSKQSSIINILLSVGCGIKACLDDPFFENYQFDNSIIIGAKKNNMPLNVTHNENFENAITTPEALRSAISQGLSLNAIHIKKALIENLRLHPNNSELLATLRIINSLYSLKMCCLFFLADKKKSIEVLSQQLPQELVADYKHLIVNSSDQSDHKLRCVIL